MAVLACDPARTSGRTSPLDGWRVIAEPAALDAAQWPSGSTVVRISPDDVFVIAAAPGGPAPLVPGDVHAIVTPELGFAGATLTAAEVAHVGLHHIEWELPAERPALAQGRIAGVPAKLVLHADGSALLLVACAARAELEERLA
ncbi:MAG: hypothetical protein ACO3AV_00910 [Ilumatobacteraceae bacterium]